MNTIYTMQPIVGKLPEHKRQAKENLAIMVEDALMKPGLVKSYSLIDSKSFPYPNIVPNFTMLGDFFGSVEWDNKLELDQLFEQPFNEMQDYQMRLREELKTADDQSLIAMVRQYHYVSDEALGRHKNAVETFDKAWENAPKNEMTSVGRHHGRRALVRSLNAIDDLHVQNYLGSVELVKTALKKGRKDEVKDHILGLYDNWRRLNLAPLFNRCKDALYRHGYWMARIVTQDEDYLGITERVFKVREMPSQIVKLKN